MNARVALSIAALLLAGPAFAQTKGQLQLPEFAALADKASETVNVTLDANLLRMACRFLDADADPEQAAAKKLCTGLTGIYVRHFTFEDDFAYPKVDIDGVRRQLSAPGWSRIVEARSKKENTNVDVFILLNGDKAQGLSIIASEPREFTIVNIVGSIDLEQLHDLEGKFGVPNLEIETGKKPAPAKPPAPGKPK
jgi:hypothetical protein